MMRLIWLVVFLYIITDLVWRFAAFAGIPLDDTSFGIGIGVATLAGFIVFQLQDWWSSATRPYRPQSVKIETKETPAQITFEAIFSFVKVIVVIALVIGFLVTFHRELFPFLF
ncbi:MAG TPA: hypothetical protein VJG32_07360 [Anaerolineae bacterium]|nr:hypothetical protein [Anaerolineae bacterium]